MKYKEKYFVLLQLCKKWFCISSKWTG